MLKKFLNLEAAKYKFWISAVLLFVSLLSIWKFGINFGPEYKNTDAVDISGENLDQVVIDLESNYKVIHKENAENETRLYFEILSDEEKNNIQTKYPDIQMINVQNSFDFGWIEILIFLLTATIISTVLNIIFNFKRFDSKKLFILNLSNVCVFGFIIIFLLGIASLLSLFGFVVDSFVLALFVAIIFALIMEQLIFTVFLNDEDQETKIKSISKYYVNMFEKKNRSILWILGSITVLVLPFALLEGMRVEMLFLIFSLWIDYCAMISLFPAKLSLENISFKSKQKKRK